MKFHDSTGCRRVRPSRRRNGNRTVETVASYPLSLVSFVQWIRRGTTVTPYLSSRSTVIPRMEIWPRLALEFPSFSFPLFHERDRLGYCTEQKTLDYWIYCVFRRSNELGERWLIFHGRVEKDISWILLSRMVFDTRCGKKSTLLSQSLRDRAIVIPGNSTVTSIAPVGKSIRVSFVSRKGERQSVL